jgi:hypothetical protein
MEWGWKKRLDIALEYHAVEYRDEIYIFINNIDKKSQEIIRGIARLIICIQT